MELLALLKRLAPLLNRIAPMLEMFIATRGTSHADTETVTRMASDVAEIKEERAEAAKRHGALAQAAAEQANALSSLRQDLRQIRETDERTAVRLLELETQVAGLSKSAHAVRQMGTAVLALCLFIFGALLVLLFRHA